MSVALGGGGGGGYMPMAQAAMPRMNIPNYNTSSTANASDLRMPGMSGPAESKNLRGDKSGDECLTFDSEEVVLSATWNETSCECVVSTIGSPFSESGEPIDYIGNTIRQLQLAANTEMLSREAEAAKKKSNKKKKRETSLSCGKGGITLVLSSSMSQKDIRVAVVSISDSGYNVKNIFGRGITTVTGMLARSAATSSGLGPPCNFVSVLEGSGKSVLEVDPIVLYVNFINDKRSNGGSVLDAALIVCESGKKVKNNLGYERLCTLAVANQEGDGSGGGLENVLKDLLNIAQISQERISAVVFTGSSADAKEEKCRDVLVADLFKGTKMSIFRALKEDSVRGGCLLSAAELDSSKVCTCICT
jgi:hypothetical protein